jgi:hypothetical protein
LPALVRTKESIALCKAMDWRHNALSKIERVGVK